MAVHPRGRGEHSRASCSTCRRSGSSPRTRGTPRSTGYGVRHRRFIPADAGNTSRSSSLLISRTVHPRGRGEHPATDHTRRFCRGSSPRTRGTLVHRERRRFLERFIPADAGNTPPSATRPASLAVHPRGRGEHWLAQVLANVHGGSSPRTRGTPIDHDAAVGVTRFIPADAGNTHSPHPRGFVSPVHPRGRGEHCRVGRQMGGELGSSPRTRGTRVAAIQPPFQGRFIPADAGNTRAGLTRTRATTVHPRGRGEHDFFTDQFRANIGSSPRTRGTQHLFRR